MALNSKYNFISRIKLFMYITKENTMPTNIYSVEAEITRNIVAEVEATSQEEAEELVKKFFGSDNQSLAEEGEPGSGYSDYENPEDEGALP